MAITVETLDKLERRITLSLAADVLQSEVDARLKKLARTVKADGFRPGKVPMNVVAQRYGYSVQYEVVNDKLGEAFAQAAQETGLRVAGQPRISEKEGGPVEGQLQFDATFEVYPEVKLGDLSSLELERVSSEVNDAAIDRTIEILRKQRATFADRAAAEGAADGDRVTIDFEGKIDGVPFDGGKAEGFKFILGEGQMLEAFEKAVRGMKTGESKTFPLKFPDDYHGKDVAGKTAQFTVTMKKIEWPHLPEIDADFAKSLGIEDGDLAKMRGEIKENLEREAKRRTQSIVKNQVMDALLKISELEVPKALIEQDQQRLVGMARQDLAQRGVPNAKDAPIPAEMFAEQAERRVKLGLVLAELVKANNLEAKPEQIRAEVDEFAKSYEDPKEVVRWYYSNQQRLAEMEAFVVESNVVDFVLGKAKVTDKEVSFEALASASAQA